MPDQKIYITRSHIIPEAIAYLDGIYDIEVWQQNEPPPRALMLEKAQECDALLTEVTDIIDAELLNQATNLKVVANRAVGLDNIDIPAATRNGILIGNTPGVLHESCADFTFGLILALARNIGYGERRIRAGEWTVFDQIPYLGTDVHGATLGIIGMGLIGTAVARRARAFDMRIIYNSRTRKPEVEAELGAEWREEMDAVLSEADYVSLHMPLTPETEYMVGKRELELMQPTAFLINTTRGRTVNPGRPLRRSVKPVHRGRGDRRNRPGTNPLRRPLALTRQPAHYAAHRKRKPPDRPPHGADVRGQHHRRLAWRGNAGMRQPSGVEIEVKAVSKVPSPLMGEG